MSVYEHSQTEQRSSVPSKFTLSLPLSNDKLLIGFILVNDMWVVVFRGLADLRFRRLALYSRPFNLILRSKTDQTFDVK